MNRLDDSLQLWKLVCGHRLLVRTELVLFLNKCDILEKKLRAGVRLAKYVKSFQERSNDSETVQKCESPPLLFSSFLFSIFKL